jgi:cytoskeletal protein CcmA (bactofilin family)
MLTIEADMIVNGQLIMLGAVRLDGRFEGSLICKRLDVGVDGYLLGNAVVDELNLLGQIVGSVQARLVTLKAGSILEGELVHEQLQMDETATLVGESRRQKSLKMPPEFLALQSRSQSAADDIRDLETQSRVRRADEAVRDQALFDALRARFPGPPGLPSTTR